MKPFPLAEPAVVMASDSGPSLEERLEEGKVVDFGPGALPLPPADDLDFLRTELGKAISLKNISYHPHGGHLSGLRGKALRRRTIRILHAHNIEVQSFLAEKLPRYASGWREGKVNFRPIQEKGRNLNNHSSNERVHVDAFASGATHGDRIFRFFTNIHPSESRIWRSAGTFPDLLNEFGEVSGVRARRVRDRIPDKLLSSVIRAIAGLVPAVELADTSPYDRTMLRLHDHLKDDEAFQADERRMTRMEFRPFHSWAVFTDTVSHAAVSGQHALVNTFYVRLSSCVRPELSPFNILAQAS